MLLVQVAGVALGAVVGRRRVGQGNVMTKYLLLVAVVEWPACAGAGVGAGAGSGARRRFVVGGCKRAHSGYSGSGRGRTAVSRDLRGLGDLFAVPLYI